MCVEMGGSITGEHGVGVEKRDYLPTMFTPDEIDCMSRIRAAFDPLGIANPGKMFPTSEAPALQQHGLHPLEKAGLISRE
jgi:glycolate oxidase